MRLLVKVHTTVHRTARRPQSFGITQDSCRNASNVYVCVLVVLTWHLVLY
jgi:hypothetical protein